MSTTPSLSQVAASLAGRRVLVGLSGGLDSVVLLHLLNAAGIAPRAGHVDHRLREDSGTDAAFASDYAASLAVPFSLARIDVARGNSTQGRARTQRYAALARLASRNGCDCIAVAHHADDAWESSVLQSERRAGPVGVAGPETATDWCGVPLLRPLLHVRRRALADYAAQHGLVWREDPSNADGKYARSRVRAQDSWDPELLRTRRLAAQSTASAADAVSATAERTPLTVTFGRDVLRSAEEQIVARVLLDAARTLHGELPRALVEELASAIAAGSTAARQYCGHRTVIDLTSSHVRLSASRGQGTRLADEAATPELKLRDHSHPPWFGHHIIVGRQRPDATWFPAHATLRGPRPGEAIVVGGRERGIRELLASRSVPTFDRRFWPCVYDGPTCLAVLGCVESDLLATVRGADGMFVAWRRSLPDSGAEG